LKNRVAAQTSRDRKKAKMDDMDATIQLQSEQISVLETQCKRLQQEKTEITTKYTELERKFDELKQRFDAQDEQNRRRSTEAAAPVQVKIESRSIGCGTNELYGSAASYINPLPKGSLVLQSILRDSNTTSDTALTASLWKIIALCLLYKTCSTSKTSISADWKNLPKVYSQMSPQSWKMIFEKVATQMPKMKAPQSDSLNQWWGPQQNSWNPAKISVAH
jgi:X box-binding protein 1